MSGHGSSCPGDQEHDNSVASSTGSAVPSRLEQLPAELRLSLLLSAPDIETLRCLVCSSPSFHNLYLRHRHLVLSSCMAGILDGVFVDAYATLMSRNRNFEPHRTDENIAEFTRSYRSWLSGDAPFPNPQSVTPGSLRWLVRYHRQTIEPLARSLAQWSLANLNHATSSFIGNPPGSRSKMQLSRCEEIRILRALYRYSTFHHLFGEPQTNRQGGFEEKDINGLFFCLFDPWDAEAIDCTYLFMRWRYGKIFSDVQWVFDDRNPSFIEDDDVRNTSDSAPLMTGWEVYMDGMIAQGPKLAARLFAVSDNEELVAVTLKYLTPLTGLDASMRDVVEFDAQHERRQEPERFPNERDQLQLKREAVHFAGDQVPPEGPPWAWVLLWRGKYANIYGPYVPLPLRECGFVFWDSGRWPKQEVRELITKQWKDAPDSVSMIRHHYGWSPLDEEA